MGSILDFQRAREKRTEAIPDNLNDLIKRASLICKEKFEEESGVIKAGQLKSVFESKITQEIFTRKLIGSDVFLCGIYVSKLLAELASNIPESWWAIDYFASDNLATLKKGGDVCFIICGVFPERGNHRLMDVTYYQKMGVGFYHQFGSLAKKEIGYHMSHQFQMMAEVVQSCLRNF